MKTPPIEIITETSEDYESVFNYEEEPQSKMTPSCSSLIDALGALQAYWEGQRAYNYQKIQFCITNKAELEKKYQNGLKQTKITLICSRNVPELICSMYKIYCN